MSVTSACPEGAKPTEPFEVDGEDIWRCPVCGRRTYGTGELDDDQLPSYSEVDEDGATICFHGTGEVDIEATAELAAQDGPDDEDGWGEGDPDGPGPDFPAPPEPDPLVRDVHLGDLARESAGVWMWVYGDERGWRHLADAAYDPAAGDTTVTLTYSDGEVEEEWPAPMARMVRAGEDRRPTAHLPGPAGMVAR